LHRCFGFVLSAGVSLDRLLLAAAFAGLTPFAAVHAQSPAPAAIATAPAGQGQGGYEPGWTLGTRFAGSVTSDGSVYNLGTAAGYDFSRHLAADFGVPVFFVVTPPSIQQSNPGAVSGTGLGDVFGDFRLNLPGQPLNSVSGIHFTVPTGDVSKGLSTGHVTWNLTNHLDHAFGDFSPFLNTTVGNTILDTRHFHRPYITYGYNAAFEAGLEVDPGKFSFAASAYDILPWGNQTVYSRVYRCGKSAHCSANGDSHDRKGYLNSSVTAGSADLVRDNGFNASADFQPVRHLDLEFDYSRSIPLHLNIFSFGVGVDLSWLLHKPRG
jgi:hypothetical protein